MVFIIKNNNRIWYINCLSLKIGFDGLKPNLKLAKNINFSYSWPGMRGIPCGHINCTTIFAWGRWSTQGQKIFLLEEDALTHEQSEHTCKQRADPKAMNRTHASILWSIFQGRCCTSAYPPLIWLWLTLIEDSHWRSIVEGGSVAQLP